MEKNLIYIKKSLHAFKLVDGYVKEFVWIWYVTGELCLVMDD